MTADLVERINEFGDSCPDVFGGVYLRDGEVVVCFRKRVEDHTRSAIEYLRAKGIPLRRPLRGIECEYSLRQLVEKAEVVSDDILRLKARGLDVRAVSVDVVGNRVAVSLGRVDAEITALLRSEYGDLITVHHEAAVAGPAHP